ncbi:cellulase family glycosylhydrolase [Pontibacter korlensis]|uniref:Glycoside hydrolase family 5 domain-containing protein n=1 Tax=Pontibacter korlensis TaxID=400092 RepID=A0A0E3ZG31_9BACT|nr:cellulase family glycosylhydrolase [Pontibacter korlensis]AKD03778.1 hypothetical protein PKOR_12410 [Pontibacter korlensis]
MKKNLSSILLSLCLLLSAAAYAQNQNELTISNTTFLRNGQPFHYTGIGFFNALYNPAFHKSAQDRNQWLDKFDKYGINVLRVWAQWNNTRGFVDAAPDATLYASNGELRQQPLERLKALLTDADSKGMVIQLVLFSHETSEANNKLTAKSSDRAVANITQELKPYRNLVFQIWNESSERVEDYYKAIKKIDPKRLVTNSPGPGGDLGDQNQNHMLDFLTPHTTRQFAGKHWEIAPKEIAYLLERYKKPVVDDEPARNGTPDYGGPHDGSSPYDHILQIYQVWQQGGYMVYHHDMFQKDYGHPSISPSGIPDPEFNPYHKQVLEFIAMQPRYRPEVEKHERVE